MKDSEPVRATRPSEGCVLVIFGARGDLTKRLVVPALYNLRRSDLLPEKLAIIGIDHGDESTEGWRNGLEAMLKDMVGNAGAEQTGETFDEPAWRALAERMTYLRGDFDAGETYERLGKALAEVGRQRETGGNVIFYLAIADRFFETVIARLGAAGLTNEDENGWRRVIVEKPFGNGLQSARDLNRSIRRTLKEEQIFRIDHYLGKDTVQNILALRFANGIFEPIWNRDRIDHVQITVSETLGVERRGKFYEATGALRDMVPNHVFSLISLIAMEPPTSFDAQAINARKADVFAAMRSARPENAVRGQYGAGTVAGRARVAYRQEPNVAADSNVETYVAMRLDIDNWRWAGVPFYLRTGKHLSRRVTEIAISFKQAPYRPFRATPVGALSPNWLTMHIAPCEGISQQFEVRRPGPVVALAPVRMDFKYDDWFPKRTNVGYETLLYDIMIGDASLFMSGEMAEASWRVVQPVLDAWAATTADFPNYASGSDGPAEADALLARDGGRAWRPLDEATLCDARER